MNINYLALLIATIVQFAVGALWYGPIFGKLWGHIHGFDKLPKEVQAKMIKQMGPFYAVQFGVTFLTTFVLALFVAGLPQEWNLYGIAGFVWLGFVVPTQVSSVIFGGIEPKWIMKKILLMAGASLICLESGALVLALLR